MGVNISLKNVKTGGRCTEFDSMRKNGDSDFVDLVTDDWFDNFETDYDNEFFSDFGAIRPRDIVLFERLISESELPNKQRFTDMVGLLLKNEKLAINIST